MPTLAINTDGLDDLRQSHGITTDHQFAAAIGLHRGTVSRVLAGRSAPGPRFIANTLTAFPITFGTLFDVVDEAPSPARRQADAA